MADSKKTSAGKSKSDSKTPTKPGNTANRTDTKKGAQNKNAENKQTDKRLTGSNPDSGVGKTGDELPSPPVGEKTRIPPKDKPEGHGQNAPADPSLGERETELREFAVENPADYEDLADPRKSPEDLPPGVAVGGAMVRHRDDTPPDTGKPKADPNRRGTVKAQPVRVDGRNVRNDDDALEGHEVKVIKGEHEGQKAHFVHATEYDEKTGFPTHAFIRFADTTYHTAVDVVPYEDLRPANKYIG